MKTFSPINFFTLVSFVLVMALGSAGFGGFSECLQQCKKDNDITRMPPGGNLDTTKENLATCQSDCRDLASRCDKAIDKYDKDADDLKDACASMDANSSKTCQQRINACESRGGTGGPGGSTTDQFMNMMMSAYMQKNNLSLPNDSNAQDANALQSCTDFTNDKTERAREKLEQKQEKLQQKISDLKDKIYKEKEEIDKENARLSKETNEIDVERQKVDEKVKEAIRKVDEKKGERMRKLNEDVAKSAIAIRNINNAIIKQKEATESIKFDYAQKVVQFSEDKVNKQCKAAVETAKTCFVKSSKGQKSLDPKDTCSNFSLTAKGAKGTAELKQKLKDIQEACFEQAKLSTDKARFEQQKSLRSIETDIAEKSNQVKDAQNDLERKQNDFKTIGAESDKEKSDEQANADKQLENFTNKLSGITADVQQARTRRNARMEELNAQIKSLEDEVKAAKLGITAKGESFQSTYSEASRAIKKGEGSRQGAIDVCCPKYDPKNRSLTLKLNENDSRCIRLVTDGDEIRSSGRSTKDSSGEQ